MTGREQVLEVKDLKVEVRSEKGWTNLVEKVDLSVEAGQTVGLVGESGSGKTITSLGVMHLLPSNARMTGSVLLNGREISGLPAKELDRVRGVEAAMIFQEPRRSLNPAFTVGNQVAESVRRHKGASHRDAWSRAVELFDLVGIPDAQRRSHAYPHEFSGGMCQRVMLAMALAGNPKLLIADEPTTALDVTVQRRVLQLIYELQQEFGLGVLLITHDLGVVAEVCDRAVVMRDGRIVEQAPVADLFDSPRHAYTRQLLAARDLDVRVKSEAAGPILAVKDQAPATSASQEARKLAKDPVLTVRGLSKRFILKRNMVGRPTHVHEAVRGVDFEISSGDTFAVVGESGAGKSTVGRMALRLIKPDSGEIRLLGEDIAGLKGGELRRMRAKATMIFQDPYKSLDPKMQIGAALAEPMLAQGGYGKSERADRIAVLMKRVGLGPRFLERFPYEMSGGQLQRVAIARALMTDPKVVVCDEPVAALDMSIRSQVIGLLRELQADRGLAYLFVSHDMSLVRAISDRVAVMRHGAVVECATPEQLFEKPEHEYTRKLLTAIPAPHPRARTFRPRPARPLSSLAGG